MKLSVLRICLAAVSGAVLLAGCTLQGDRTLRSYGPNAYAAITTEPHTVPAVSSGVIPDQYKRRMVTDPTGEKPGTIVVDTSRRYLYYVMSGGKAMRYGIGVGREGFGWSGTATVQHKAKWPTWTPPKEMVERQPEIAKFADGMPGGIRNPLGARALYLFQGNRDTLYRLHGTNEPWSIGRAMSSGCIRLLNQDIIDLYNRADIGTKVIVRQGAVASSFSSPNLGPFISSLGDFEPLRPKKNVKKKI